MKKAKGLKTRYELLDEQAKDRGQKGYNETLRNFMKRQYKEYKELCWYCLEQPLQYSKWLLQDVEVCEFYLERS